jgi:hypothetical protein
LRPSPKRSARLSKGALWFHHDVKKSAWDHHPKKLRSTREKPERKPWISRTGRYMPGAADPAAGRAT